MLDELNSKNADFQAIATQCLENDSLLAELLNCLKSKDETFRYNCFKVIVLLSEKHGDMLYPRWDYFLDLLSSDNTYWKMSGIQILANLAKVDTDGKIDKILDQYCSLLNSKGMIITAYAASCLGEIAQAKPHLEKQITNQLLNIDDFYNGKQIDLIHGYVIEAFNYYFEASKNKDRIVQFVNRQLSSESPRTKKQAKTFLDKWIR